MLFPIPECPVRSGPSGPPLVSVIIPSYNHREFVTSAVESVIGQSYKNFELIVVDDGSSDGSAELLTRLAGKYNFTFLTRENKGLPATLNEAIRLSNGKFISLLASDDQFSCCKLETLVQALESRGENFAVAFGDALFMDSYGKSINYRHKDKEYGNFIRFYTDAAGQVVDLREHRLYRSLLENNFIPAMSALIRKDALLAVGLFDEEIALEDWNMWLKLARNYSFIYCDGDLARYRMHESNSIRTNRKRFFCEALLILERERDYSIKNGFSSEWNVNYYRTAYFLLEGFGPAEFSKHFPLRRIPELIYYNLVRLANKYRQSIFRGNG